MHIKKFAFATLTMLAATLIASPSVDTILPIGSTETVYADITSGDWSYTVNDDRISVTLTSYSGNGGTLVIPSKLDGYTVTRIGYEAFKGNTNIGGVIIPSTVTYIGYSAFANSKITSVQIPDSVTEWETLVGDGMQFYNCKELISTDINSATIPQCAFENCTNLKKVKIGNKTSEIHDYAFKNCSNLKDVTLNKNITTIGDQAFCQTAIEKITLPSTLTYIGYEAFYNTNLISVKIPSSVTSWETHVGDGNQFKNCKKLYTVEIDSLVIPQCAFENCSELFEVKIGNNTTEIHDYAFKNCDLSLLTIGTNVTSIGREAFSGNSWLHHVVLPEKLTFLGTRAFSNCRLDDIYIPDEVTFETDWGNAETFYGNLAITITVGYCQMSNYGDFTNGTTTFNVIKGTDAESYALSKDYTVNYIKEIPATAIAFHEKEYTMSFGDTMYLFPELTPQNSTDSITWSVSDDFVVDVDENGKVTALMPGTAKVTAKAKSGKKATCTIDVVVDGETTKDSDYQKRDVSLASVSKDFQKSCEYKLYPLEQYAGELLYFNPIIQMAKDVDYTVSYKNNTKVGTATIIYKGIGKYTGTLKKTFKITPLDVTKAYSGIDITLSKTNYTYTGKALKPTISVSHYGTKLKAGTDYTVKYTKNTNAGTATATITFKGNYTGSIKKTFKINAKKATSAKVTLSKSSYTYTGKAIKPSVKVVLGDVTLKEGTDYTVKYSNNVKVGTATATVTFKGNYSGSVKKNFKITK